MRLLITTQAVDLDDPVLGFFHRWIEEFAKHCEHIHVICLKEGRHALPANVAVHSLGKERGVGRLRYVLNFYKYIWSLRNEYDAVFVHMNPEYVVLGGPLWRLGGKRIALWYTHKSVTMWLRIAMRLAHMIFTASTDSFRLKSDKVIIFGHGIEVDRAREGHRNSNGTIRILSVGRISKSKRVLEMLEVLYELHAQQTPFSFTLAGEPATAADREYANLVQQAIRRCPFRTSITVLGAVNHERIPHLLAQADVFVNLSTTGGMDKAVLEALSAGVPVVTTNETFQTILEQHGLMVPVYRPRAVAAAILHARSVDTAFLQEYVHREHSLARLIERIQARIA